jgi:m7GpppX diphosphatase
LGKIDQEPALIVLERAPFPTSEDYLASIPSTLARLKNLGANDIYHWYMARSGVSADSKDGDFHADLKINLIFPCTDKHIKKYSKQGVRFVIETPDIYRNHVRPLMQTHRDEGRLNWVFNILDGRTEVEDVIFRTKPWDVPGQAEDDKEGFLLLPDLNWDRKTLDALHLLALVERRDLWSLRDLRKKHVGWLKKMKEHLLDATTETYPSIERDQIKLYVHYQPTYYHLHVHIVHVALEAGATQATGKAVGLESIIETLEVMDGGDENGMDRLSMGYTLGEASELWQTVFRPLK